MILEQIQEIDEFGQTREIFTLLTFILKPIDLKSCTLRPVNHTPKSYISKPLDITISGCLTCQEGRDSGIGALCNLCPTIFILITSNYVSQLVCASAVRSKTRSLTGPAGMDTIRHNGLRKMFFCTKCRQLALAMSLISLLRRVTSIPQT